MGSAEGHCDAPRRELPPGSLELSDQTRGMIVQTLREADAPPHLIAGVMIGIIGKPPSFREERHDD